MSLEQVFLRYITKDADADAGPSAGAPRRLRREERPGDRRQGAALLLRVAHRVRRVDRLPATGGWFFFNLLSRFNFLLSIYSAMRNPEAQTRLNLNEFVIAPLLHNLSVVLVILIPVITMRSFAEEKRGGTYELLMTSPLSITEIVFGKFLGAFVFLLVMIGLTGVYPAILLLYGNPEPGVIAAGYLGLLLLAVAFASIGLLTSSFTENQIIAAVSCLVLLLLLYVIAWPAETAGRRWARC